MVVRKRPAKHATEDPAPADRKRHLMNAPSQQIHVKVERIGGESINVEFESTITVDKVKAVVAEKRGVPKSALKLLDGTNILKGSAKVRQCSASDGMHIINLTGVVCLEQLCDDLKCPDDQALAKFRANSGFTNALRDLERLGPKVTPLALEAVCACIERCAFNESAYEISHFLHAGISCIVPTQPNFGQQKSPLQLCFSIIAQAVDKQPVVSWLLSRLKQHIAVEAALEHMTYEQREGLNWKRNTLLEVLGVAVLHESDGTWTKVVVEWWLQEMRGRAAPERKHCRVLFFLRQVLDVLCGANQHVLPLLTPSVMLLDARDDVVLYGEVSRIFGVMLKELKWLHVKYRQDHESHVDQFMEILQLRVIKEILPYLKDATIFLTRLEFLFYVVLGSRCTWSNSETFLRQFTSGRRTYNVETSEMKLHRNCEYQEIMQQLRNCWSASTVRVKSIVLHALALISRPDEKLPLDLAITFLMEAQVPGSGQKADGEEFGDNRVEPSCLEGVGQIDTATDFTNGTVKALQILGTTCAKGDARAVTLISSFLLSNRVDIRSAAVAALRRIVDHVAVAGDDDADTRHRPVTKCKEPERWPRYERD